MKKIDQISHLLVVITAILFVGFYLCLSFYNRPASDDIILISNIKGESVFHVVKEAYLYFSGRWASWIYAFSLFSITDTFDSIHNYIFLYYIVTLLIFCYSVSSILCFGLKKIFNAQIDRKTIFIYSVLFIASFFYFTFSHIEAWWWVCASFHYLQGIVLLLFGISFLIREKKKYLHYLGIILSFIYVGGCFEVSIIIILSIFFFLGILYLRKKSNLQFKQQIAPYIKGFYVAFIAFSLSAITCFSAPGNIKKRAEWKNQNAINTLEVSSDIYMQKKYLLAIGLSSFWLLLGMRIKNSSKLTITKEKIKNVLLLTATPLLLSVIVTWLFQVFILYNTAMPIRGWTFISFTLTVFCCTIFLYIGYYLNFSSIYIHSFLKVIVPVCVNIALLLIFIKQYNFTSKYATEYDALINTLIEAKNNSKIEAIRVKELPPSGMLTPLDIKDDYIKIPLKRIFELDCEIEIEK